jgi:hypothetical protein
MHVDCLIILFQAEIFRKLTDFGRNGSELSCKSALGTDYSNEKSMKPVAEFKFACPVCHQHIMADSSAAGTQVECPTCFRQIIVPKAPTGETTKLILRGTQAGKAQTRFQSTPPGNSVRSKTSLGKLAAFVTLIVATIAFAVSAYAKHNDRVQKATGKTEMNHNMVAAATR